MQVLNRKSFAALGVAILASTCLGFGSWRFHKSSDRATDVTFESTAKFNNGATLPAGTYQIEIPKDSPSPAVTFYQNGKAVATIKANVVAQEKKNEGTAIESVTQGNTELVTTIQPDGWKESITFGSGGQPGSANAGQ
jgi:hypothetical protein